MVCTVVFVLFFFFFFQAEDGIRDLTVTGVQTCALPICSLALTASCAGGLFSVALSVAESSQTRPPGVTRRVALQSNLVRRRTAVSGLSSRPSIVRCRPSDHPTCPPVPLYAARRPPSTRALVMK